MHIQRLRKDPCEIERWFFIVSIRSDVARRVEADSTLVSASVVAGTDVYHWRICHQTISRDLSAKHSTNCKFQNICLCVNYFSFLAAAKKTDQCTKWKYFWERLIRTKYEYLIGYSGLLLWPKKIIVKIIIIIIMTCRQLRSVAATPHDVHVHLHSATSVCRCSVADLLYPGFSRAPKWSSSVHPQTLPAFHCNDLT